MTKDEVQRLLQRYCCTNEIEGVQELLNDYPNDIDLTAKDSQAFAICMSYGYVNLLKVLIDSYKETKLQGDIESKEYKVSYHTLQYMLEEALEQTEPSQEIRAIIDQYLCNIKDSESDNISTAPEDFIYDHEVLDEPRDSGASEHDSDTTLDLTIYNLKQWSESYPRQELAGHLPHLPEEI